MSKIVYVPKQFTPAHRNTIKRANAILEEYAVQGFTLTLRQLYYQFVARGFIPNQDKSYKMLGGIVGEARLAGQIDWEHLEDRTRNVRSITHFDGPGGALKSVAGWYHDDLWATQRFRPEVWIEKDALAGVISGVCDENDVPYFSCRGYTSLSEMWRAALRFQGYRREGKVPYIIHLGDHDPSGIDMSRDIVERIANTFRTGHEFVRVALNMDQIEEHQPPPNPAKVTDSRYEAYLAKFGDESWELDALEPSMFRELIQGQLDGLRDDEKWDEAVKGQERSKRELTDLSQNWDSVKRERGHLGRVIRAAEKVGWPTDPTKRESVWEFVSKLGTERDGLKKEVERLRRTGKKK